MAFKKRTTCPDVSEKWWKTSFSPCITGSAKQSSTYGTTIPNCFSGDTEIITSSGQFKLKDIVGKTVSVPTIDGSWHEATVHNFGVQRLWEVKLGRNTYYASANHRWVVYSQSGKTHRILTTDELKPGMHIRYTFFEDVEYAENLDGIRHGFVFGDGCEGYKGRYTDALVCGVKREFMPKYFEGMKCYVYSEGTLDYPYQTPRGKLLPSIDEDNEYLYNFMRGYFAADGSVDEEGSTINITCKHPDTLYKVKDILHKLRITCGDVTTKLTSGYTGLAEVSELSIYKSCLTPAFFLNPKHRQRFCSKSKKRKKFTQVISVKPTNKYEEVYCPVEPVTHTCTLGGGELTGQCVGYAWGRYAEIYGGYPTGLPSCNAGDWYASDSTHQKGKTPKLGAVLVLGKSGDAGHVAVVEEIHSDGSITTSESGWGCSWSNRFWTQKRYPPNYCNRPYYFIGFIYNPKVSDSDTAEVDINDMNHPARRFVAEAEKHVGDGGHAWVKSMTSIGNGAWCAATMCAVAIACGFDGIIMPRANYWAAGFGEDIIEKYGGQYFKGPMRGNDFTPQVGDIIEYVNSEYGGRNYDNDPYHAYHVGVVKEVNGDEILTIEGNTNGGKYQMNHKNRKGSNIGWYARPDWTKVGGSMIVGGGWFQSGKLYTTKSTRADASLREVGYLDSKGKPSIKSSGVRLSVINYTGLLSDFVRVFGGSSGTSGSPDNIDGLTPPVAREIVEYLVGKGLNTAAAIGVIANVKAESGFDVGAVEKGPPYEGRGICQWSFGRRTAMISYVGADWANNLTGQLNFLWHELTTSYKSSVLEPLQGVPNTLAGAQDAAEIFVRKFEIPGGIEQAVVTRRKNAEEFWNMVIVTSNTDGGSSAAQGKITTRSGKQLTSGTSVVIPSSVPQTGIVANYTSYTQFYGRWSRGTIQRQLSEIWGQQGKPNSHSVATINGYYLIAMSSKFATTGDIVSVVLEDGTYFNAILGDSKGSDAGSEWGHYLGNQIDIVEWEAYGTDQSALRSGLRRAGWLGKKVTKVINYGPWLD